MVEYFKRMLFGVSPLRTLHIPCYTYSLLGTIKILDSTSIKNNKRYKTLYCQHEKKLYSRFIQTTTNGSISRRFRWKQV